MQESSKSARTEEGRDKVGKEERITRKDRNNEGRSEK
jgi:hypothetical protein